MKKLTTQLLIGLLVAISCLSFDLKAQTSEQNQSLSEKHKGLIPIAAYTAIGDLQNLKPALNNGLDAGLTVNEIKEAMVHLYAYAGFPRSIRGLQTFMEVLDEREARGINDEYGPGASPVNDERSKYERGRDILEELTGVPPESFQSGYAEFAPVIEVFLKEHLFADLFARDVLNYAQRELVTISILSSLDGLEPMLGGHFNICLNIGLTPSQLQQFVGVIESTLGEEKATGTQAVLDEVLKSNRLE